MKEGKQRKPRKLPVYQYRLPLRIPHDPKIEPVSKAHLVFYSGYWHLFRNRYKSQFRSHPWIAAQITGKSICETQNSLRKAHDRYRFGYPHD